MEFQTLKLQKFTKEHIPEYLLFCYDSYLASTNTYVNSPQARHYFNQLTIEGVQRFIEAAQVVNSRRGTNTLFNYFVRKDGKMIAAFFHCELHYFFKELIKAKLFQDNFYSSIPLEKILEVKQYTAVLGYRATIRNEYQRTGLFRYIASQRKKNFLKQGYEYGYGLSKHEKVIGFYSNNSGQFVHSFQKSFMNITYEWHFFRAKYCNVPDFNSAKPSL